MVYQPTDYHPAFEEYSETIYELAEDGIEVIQARIAERLDVSRPAVSEMIGRMGDEGLVEVDDHGLISLTASGHSLAISVVRRHRIAERVLTDILGLGWSVAHHEAGRWEHIITPRVEAAMLSILDNPDTCPHGNPIPGSGYQQPDGAIALSQIATGDGFTVHRIPESIEFATGQLEFLEKMGLVPGSCGTVISRSPDGALTVDIDGNIAALSSHTVEQLIVAPNP